MQLKMRRILYLLMAVFMLLYVLANFDFMNFKVDLSNWTEYIMILLFYVLLLLFWRVVENIHAEQVNQASITDSLSKLFTSQHYFRSLESEIDRSKRRKHDLSTLYIDIDYFHRFNETRGIKAGDRVLRFFGDLVRNSTRKYDSGFRFGSDEFALILPETDRMQSRIIAERIRESFFNQYGGELALSIGVATLDEHDTIDRLVRKAESAMEDARRGGGNRIRAYIERGQI